MYNRILRLALIKIIGTMALSPHHFPNGKLIKFTPNLYQPRTDLIYLEPKRAAIISTNWMTNIMHHNSYSLRNKINEDDFKSKNMINYEDIEKQRDVADLIPKEKFHEDKISNTSSFLLGWSPRGTHGRREILFIVYNKIDYNENKIKVCQLIQSPFWSPRSIPSEYLKMSLLDLCKTIEGYDLCLENLYIKDFRYRLAWNTWNLDSEEIEENNIFPNDGEVKW